MQIFTGYCKYYRIRSIAIKKPSRRTGVPPVPKESRKLIATGFLPYKDNKRPPRATVSNLDKTRIGGTLTLQKPFQDLRFLVRLSLIYRFWCAVRHHNKSVFA